VNKSPTDDINKKDKQWEREGSVEEYKSKEDGKLYGLNMTCLSTAQALKAASPAGDITLGDGRKFRRWGLIRQSMQLSVYLCLWLLLPICLCVLATKMCCFI
jgi:hypothetical protein